MRTRQTPRPLCPGAADVQHFRRQFRPTIYGNPSLHLRLPLLFRVRCWNQKQYGEQRGVQPPQITVDYYFFDASPGFFIETDLLTRGAQQNDSVARILRRADSRLQRLPIGKTALRGMVERRRGASLTNDGRLLLFARTPTGALHCELNTTKQPNVKFVQNPRTYREAYANSVQIRVNVWDFFLVFGTMQQSTETQVELRNFQGII